MAYTIDQLVEGYIKFRDQADEMKKEYQLKVAPIHDAMAQLEAVFLQRMQADGIDSISTPHGTPYTSVKTNCSVEDRAAFFDWCIATGNQGMMTISASKAALDVFIEQTKDTPPGLKVSREMVVNVRRPTKAK